MAPEQARAGESPSEKAGSRLRSHKRTAKADGSGEVVTDYDPLLAVQEKLIANQRRIIKSQDGLIDALKQIIAIQEELLADQEELLSNQDESVP